MLERLVGEPHTRLRYFCSPQATDSALFPVIGQMERAGGFANDDDAEAKLDKLEALVSPAASPEDVALLAELLSLPTLRYPASTASKQTHALAEASLKTHAPLQTRVGIATGLVVVGDLIGFGASQEQAIVGETPNLAARLQGVAEPNSVVIAESTRRLVGNLFELDDLGARHLKGIAGPVGAWAALRPSSVESRFEAMHASGLTELIGRQEEIEILLRRWSK